MSIFNFGVNENNELGLNYIPPTTDDHKQYEIRSATAELKAKSTEIDLIEPGATQDAEWFSAGHDFTSEPLRFFATLNEAEKAMSRMVSKLQHYEGAIPYWLMTEYFIIEWVYDAESGEWEWNGDIIDFSRLPYYITEDRPNNITARDDNNADLSSKAIERLDMLGLNTDDFEMWETSVSELSDKKFKDLLGSDIYDELESDELVNYGYLYLLIVAILEDDKQEIRELVKSIQPHIPNIKNAVNKALRSFKLTTKITKGMDGIILRDHVGTWYVIDSRNDINYGKIFLLESELYGDEAAALIVKEDGQVLVDDVWNGFSDLYSGFQDRF